MADTEGAGISASEKQAPDRYNPHGAEEVTHLCPPVGSHIMACCGHSPVEMPLWHRLTLDPGMVTCEGKDSGDE